MHFYRFSVSQYQQQPSFHFFGFIILVLKFWFAGNHFFSEVAQPELSFADLSLYWIRLGSPDSACLGCGGVLRWPPAVSAACLGSVVVRGSLGSWTTSAAAISPHTNSVSWGISLEIPMVGESPPQFAMSYDITWRSKESEYLTVWDKVFRWVTWYHYPLPSSP